MVSTLVPRFCLSAIKESVRRGTDIPGGALPNRSRMGEVACAHLETMKKSDRLAFRDIFPSSSVGRFKILSNLSLV